MSRLTPPENIPWVGAGFDLGELERLTAGDRRALCNLLCDLLKVNRDDLRRLHQCRAVGDVTGLAALAHRIKGGVRLIGAHEVIEACQGLEDACAQAVVVTAEIVRQLRTLSHAAICLEVGVRRHLGRYWCRYGRPPTG